MLEPEDPTGCTMKSVDFGIDCEGELTYDVTDVWLALPQYYLLIVTLC